MEAGWSLVIERLEQVRRRLAFRRKMTDGCWLVAGLSGFTLLMLVLAHLLRDHSACFYWLTLAVASSATVLVWLLPRSIAPEWAGWLADRRLASADLLATALIAEAGPFTSAIQRQAARLVERIDPVAIIPWRVDRAAVAAIATTWLLGTVLALAGWPEPMVQIRARQLTRVAADVQRAAAEAEALHGATTAATLRSQANDLLRGDASVVAALAEAAGKIEQERLRAELARDAIDVIESDPNLAALRRGAVDAATAAQAVATFAAKVQGAPGAGHHAAAVLERAADLLADADLASEMRLQARLVARGEVAGERMVETLGTLQQMAQRGSVLELVSAPLARALKGLGVAGPMATRPAGPRDPGQEAATTGGERDLPLTNVVTSEEGGLLAPTAPLSHVADIGESARSWSLEDDDLVRAYAAALRDRKP